jgi:hypothetical protein
MCAATRSPAPRMGVGPQPHIVGDDLNDVANQLIARHDGRAQLASQHEQRGGVL